MPSTKIPLGQYLFRRIRDLGVHNIFGVPGDFNLNLLDHLYSVDNLQWLGCCNELNAAYAADGYARSRGGLPGVVLTTFTVGELSALNGIAGAFSEHVPVIHIVGTTPRAAQAKRMMIHHCLGDNWDHTTMQAVAKTVSTAIAVLDDDDTFTREVDRVIEACVKTRRPVYIFVPTDIPDILVDAARLTSALDLIIRNPGQEELEDMIVERILARLATANRPAVLVDALTQRFTLKKEVNDFLLLTKLPAFHTVLGKSIVDETYDHFQGLYMGVDTPMSEIKDAVESADCVIHFGPFPSDTNTGGWSWKLPRDGLIQLHPEYVSVGEQRWSSISFVPIVKKLVDQVSSRAISISQGSWCQPRRKQTLHETMHLTGPLAQSRIWNVLGCYLKDGDLLLGEVGSSSFGTQSFQLPANCEYYNQLFYSSIGFTLPALLGGMVARRETAKNGRAILFIGDGSLQMTAQEISSIIRFGFHPTIFVINNAGYTVERVIHAPVKVHNDIPTWNYQLLLQAFGCRQDAPNSHRVATFEGLTAVLNDENFQRMEQIQLVECILHKYDSPPLMSNMIDSRLASGTAALEQDDQRNGRSRVVIDGSLTESGLSAFDRR